MSARCDHQPRPDSCRTGDGAVADLMNGHHYPITAVCLNCGEPIRSEQFLIVPGCAPWRVVRTAANTR